ADRQRVEVDGHQGHLRDRNDHLLERRFEGGWGRAAGRVDGEGRHEGSGRKDVRDQHPGPGAEETVLIRIRSSHACGGGPEWTPPLFPSSARLMFTAAEIRARCVKA